MPAKRGRKSTGKPRSTRASVSLPPAVYETLQALAKEKKVSISWVMRDAAEKYVENRWPLIGKP